MGSLALFSVFFSCSHLGILPFLEGLKRSNTWTAILANLDQYSLVMIHHGNLHLLEHHTLNFFSSSHKEVDMVVLQRGQGTSLILPCHCNDRSHEIALRLRELIALSPSLRADSLSVLWTLTCQVTGKNQRTNPWTHQRMEEVSSSMREPVVWMVKVLRAEEKPAGHL